ncbi:MAG: class I SAM-dependent methyltransferase [Dysgonamonadaceae bacterium]|nr:class I SAM-dependent methyltransferase [Dysgonamonadaceae bacterium]
MINSLYYCLGTIFLLIAKIKHHLSGYSPKQFSAEETQRSIEYDITVVESWLNQLKAYTSSDSLKDKNVLELGPGSDLGAGLYLLSKAAEKYFAADIYELESKTSAVFYDAFFDYLKNHKKIDTTALTEELNKTRNCSSHRLNYTCHQDFDIVKAVGENKIDIVLSNAAFEHFNDVRQTIKKLDGITHSGSVFIALVDLQTHSRWIREKDPNNIYRYSDWLYKLLGTQSSPNRVRPYLYKEYLEKSGWENIVIQPATILDKNACMFSQKSLDKQFQGDINQMDFLDVWICATKI